jgi:hypothetical protein
MVTVLQWLLFSAHYRPLTCKHAHFPAVVFFWCQCCWMGSVFFVTAPLWILTGNCTPSLPYCHIGYHPSSFTVLTPSHLHECKGRACEPGCCAMCCRNLSGGAEEAHVSVGRLLLADRPWCVCCVREWVSEWGCMTGPPNFQRTVKAGGRGLGLQCEWVAFPGTTSVSISHIWTGPPPPPPSYPKKKRERKKTWSGHLHGFGHGIIKGELTTL